MALRLDPSNSSQEILKVFPAGPPRRRNLRKTAHTIKTGRRCLEAGTKLWTTRVGFTEETHIASVKYPFLAYRYFIDDVELVGDQNYSNEPRGRFILTKTVSYPEFEESQFYLMGEKQEVRKVKLSFERRSHPLRPQLTQLLISNDPERRLLQRNAQNRGCASECPDHSRWDERNCHHRTRA